jgi:hypothetical protein
MEEISTTEVPKISKTGDDTESRSPNHVRAVKMNRREPKLTKTLAAQPVASMRELESTNPDKSCAYFLIYEGVIRVIVIGTREAKMKAFETMEVPIRLKVQLTLVPNPQL